MYDNKNVPQNIYFQVREEIIKLAEPSYQQFSSKLLPGTERIVGVRLPLLRKLAKQIIKKQDWREYLSMTLIGDTEAGTSPEKTTACEGELFEEIMLQGFLIGYAPLSLEERFAYLDKFIPKIDNWSVCDSVCATMKFTLENKKETWNYLQKHVKSGEEYGIRFAVVMYINYYINEEYFDRVLEELGEIKHPAYYVKMAVAWALSMCYVFNTKKTENFLQTCTLDDFTYNKAIQKVIESRQIDKQKKEELKKKKRTGVREKSKTEVL